MKWSLSTNKHKTDFFFFFLNVRTGCEISDAEQLRVFPFRAKRATRPETAHLSSAVIFKQRHRFLDMAEQKYDTQQREREKPVR